MEKSKKSNNLKIVKCESFEIIDELIKKYNQAKNEMFDNYGDIVNFFQFNFLIAKSDYIRLRNFCIIYASKNAEFAKLFKDAKFT